MGGDLAAQLQRLRERFDVGAYTSDEFIATARQIVFKSGVQRPSEDPAVQEFTEWLLARCSDGSDSADVLDGVLAEWWSGALQRDDVVWQADARWDAVWERLCDTSQTPPESAAAHLRLLQCLPESWPGREAAVWELYAAACEVEDEPWRAASMRAAAAHVTDLLAEQSAREAVSWALAEARRRAAPVMYVVAARTEAPFDEIRPLWTWPPSNRELTDEVLSVAWGDWDGLGTADHIRLATAAWRAQSRSWFEKASARISSDPPLQGTRYGIDDRPEFGLLAMLEVLAGFPERAGSRVDVGIRCERTQSDGADHVCAVWAGSRVVQDPVQRLRWLSAANHSVVRLGFGPLAARILVDLAQALLELGEPQHALSCAATATDWRDSAKIGKWHFVGPGQAPMHALYAAATPSQVEAMVAGAEAAAGRRLADLTFQDRQETAERIALDPARGDEYLPRLSAEANDAVPPSG